MSKLQPHSLPSSNSLAASSLPSARTLKAAILFSALGLPFISESEASGRQDKPGATSNAQVTSPPQKQLNQEEQFDRGVFTQLAKYRTAQKDFVEVPAIMRGAIEYAKANPGIGAIELLREINKNQLVIQAARDKAQSNGRKLSDYDLTSSILEVAKSSPNYKKSLAANIALQIRRAIRADSEILLEGTLGDRIAGQDAMSVYLTRYQRLNSDTTWKEVWNYAKENHEFAGAADLFLLRYVQASPIRKGAENLDANPDIRDINQTLAKIHKNGKATGEELKELRKQINERVIADLAATRRSVAELVAKAQKSELNAQALERERHKLAVQSASVGLVAETMRIFGGPEMADAARKFEGLANATIALNTALNNMSNIKDLGGGVIFASNVLGIFSSVANLFASGGPTADQLILKQLEAIGQELTALHKEMREHFLHVDRKLDKIFVTVIEGFDSLHRVLGDQGKTIDEISQEIKGIHVNVSALHSQLNGLETNVRSYVLAAVERREHEDVKKYVEFPERFRGTIPLESWRNGLAVFATWGTKNSKDDFSVGTMPKESELLEDAEAFQRLSKGHLSSHLDYLGRVAQRRFGYDRILPRDGTRVSDAAQWIRASEHYLTMLDMAPEHLAELKPKDLQDLYDEGQRILTAHRAINTPEPGKPLNSNVQLFDKLIDNYALKVASFQQAVAKMDSNLEIDVLAGVPSAQAAGVALKIDAPPFIKYGALDFSTPPVFVDLANPELTYLYKLERNPKTESEKKRGPISITFEAVPKNEVVSQVTKTSDYFVPQYMQGNKAVSIVYAWQRNHVTQSSSYLLRAVLPATSDFSDPKTAQPLLHFNLGTFKCVTKHEHTGDAKMIRTHERFEFVTKGDDATAAYERAAFPNKVGVGGYPFKVRDEQAKSEIPQEERFKADWGEVLKSEKSKWEISKPTEGQNGVMLQRIKERVAVILTERVRAIDLDKKAALLAITSGKTYKPTFIRLDDLTAVEKSLKELSGARALLRGFTYLGHPTSLAKNPEMVRLLSEQHGIYGMDQIRDASTVKKDFDYLRPNTGEISKRTEALKVALFEALHPSNTVKIPTQRFEEIEGTLAKLKNAIDEVNIYAK